MIDTVAQAHADAATDRAGSVAEASGVLQPYAERVMDATEIDYLTVMDTDRTRYTHRNEWQIGRAFVGTTAPALRGETFTEVYDGTLGPSVRAVVPVVTADGEVVGMVSAGVTLDRLWDSIVPRLVIVGIGTLLAFGAGAVAAACSRAAWTGSRRARARTSWPTSSPRTRRCCTRSRRACCSSRTARWCSPTTRRCACSEVAGPRCAVRRGRPAPVPRRPRRAGRRPRQRGRSGWATGCCWWAGTPPRRRAGTSARSSPCATARSCSGSPASCRRCAPSRRRCAPRPTTSATACTPSPPSSSWAAATRRCASSRASATWASGSRTAWCRRSRSRSSPRSSWARRRRRASARWRCTSRRTWRRARTGWSPWTS